jgi:hypothetical protein
MHRTPLIAAALALLCAAPGARAQDEGDAAIARPATGAAAAPEAQTPSQYILLREGSRLVSVAGTVSRDERTGAWRFHIDPDDATAPGYVLTLLPCAMLEDMRHVLLQMPTERITFEVTGEVFVYRDGNFLLPTHAPAVVAIETPPPPPPSQDDEEVPADDSVDDIMRDLEQSVGGLPRRTTAVADAPRQAGAAGEGTVLLARRGQLARSRSGAWMFVFDADAEGLGDPPMVMMPCLQLERLEEHVRKSGMNAPILITGRAFTFDRRSYLLPSLYTVPRQRTVLTP